MSEFQQQFPGDILFDEHRSLVDFKARWGPNFYVAGSELREVLAQANRLAFLNCSGKVYLRHLVSAAMSHRTRLGRFLAENMKWPLFAIDASRDSQVPDILEPDEEVLDVLSNAISISPDNAKVNFLDVCEVLLWHDSTASVGLIEWMSLCDEVRAAKTSVVVE